MNQNHEHDWQAQYLKEQQKGCASPAFHQKMEKMHQRQDPFPISPQIGGISGTNLQDTLLEESCNRQFVRLDHFQKALFNYVRQPKGNQRSAENSLVRSFNDLATEIKNDYDKLNEGRCDDVTN